jgi:hypothetical protein
MYSTFFWAHPLTSGCLATAFAMVVALAESVSSNRDIKLSMVAGLIAGWAVLSEYPAAGGSVLIAGLAIWQVRSGGRKRILRVFIAISIGALLPAILLFGYNAAAFGSPFRLSYGTVVGLEGHHVGFFGLTYPRPDVVLQLLVGSYRGLFIVAPVLVGAACALVALARRPQHRTVAIVAGVIFVYFLLLNASFFYWWAGWCVGPRYMAAGLPFLCVGLAPALDAGGRPGRIGFTLLAGVGVLICLAVLSTNPMPPESVASPVWELALPSFVRGQYSRNTMPLFKASPTASFNLGEWFGLKSHFSVLPLVIMWVVLGVLWVRQDRRVIQQQKGTLPKEVPHQSLS